MTTLNDMTHCIAVPGADSIIDMIHPNTGKTCVNGKTLEDCQREEPLAVLMPIDEFCQDMGKRQDTPIEWEETTEEQYDEMLGVLPPIEFGEHGFLVGEPWDHHALTGHARYEAYIRKGQHYFRSTRPMTRKEFRQL